MSADIKVPSLVSLSVEMGLSFADFVLTVLLSGEEEEEGVTEKEIKLEFTSLDRYSL